MASRGALLISVFFALPLAAASGTLAVGPASVEIENGHHDDCIETATGLCPAALERGSPGEMKLDLAQRLQRTVLRVDGDHFNALLPRPLLPGLEIVLDASQLYVEHPVIMILTPVVGETRAPAPLDDQGIIMSREGIFLTHLGPPIHGGIEPTLGRRTWTIAGYSDHGLNDHRIGPFNEIGLATQTDYVLQTPATLCYVFPQFQCYHATAPVAAALTNATPNAETGFEVHETAVATVPEDPTPPAAPSLGEAAGAATFAAAPLPPPPKLARGTQHALPVLTLHPTVADPPAERARPSPAAPDAPRVRLAGEDVAPRSPHPLLSAAPLAAAFVIAAAIAALYSRISSRAEALAHAARQRVLELVRERPRTVSEIARALGVDRSTALYHVRVLARMAAVVVRRRERNVLVSLPGVPLPEVAPTVQGAPAMLLALLKAHGGALARSDLHARAGDIPHRTRNHALRDLVTRGLVERRFAGNEELVALTGRA